MDLCSGAGTVLLPSIRYPPIPPLKYNLDLPPLSSNPATRPLAPSTLRYQTSTLGLTSLVVVCTKPPRLLLWLLEHSPAAPPTETTSTPLSFVGKSYLQPLLHHLRGRSHYVSRDCGYRGRAEVKSRRQERQMRPSAAGEGATKQGSRPERV